MTKPITKEEILSVQKAWGESIVNIGKLFLEKKDVRGAAKKLVADFYGYDNGTVLFKPTKARVKQFRPTAGSAVSYFVGGDNEFAEDKGFALQPWTRVRFENHGFIIKDEQVITMGNYFFTDLKGKETMVEYTIGFFRASNGGLKINLHHSSLPYRIN